MSGGLWNKQTEPRICQCEVLSNGRAALRVGDIDYCQMKMLIRAFTLNKSRLYFTDIMPRLTIRFHLYYHISYLPLYVSLLKEALISKSLVLRFLPSSAN